MVFKNSFYTEKLIYHKIVKMLQMRKDIFITVYKFAELAQLKIDRRSTASGYS